MQIEDVEVFDSSGLYFKLYRSLPTYWEIHTFVLADWENYGTNVSKTRNLISDQNTEVIYVGLKSVEQCSKAYLILCIYNELINDHFVIKFRQTRYGSLPL